MSPTVAGSRPGGLIAGAWAALMSLGQEGVKMELSVCIPDIYINKIFFYADIIFCYKLQDTWKTPRLLWKCRRAYRRG